MTAHHTITLGIAATGCLLALASCPGDRDPTGQPRKHRHDDGGSDIYRRRARRRVQRWSARLRVRRRLLR
jgi:hypothetical protein